MAGQRHGASEVHSLIMYKNEAGKSVRWTGIQFRVLSHLAYTVLMKAGLLTESVIPKVVRDGRRIRRSGTRA